MNGIFSPGSPAKTHTQTSSFNKAKPKTSDQKKTRSAFSFNINHLRIKKKSCLPTYPLIKIFLVRFTTAENQ